MRLLPSKTDMLLLAGTGVFGAAGFASTEFAMTFGLLSATTALGGLVCSRTLRRVAFGDVQTDWLGGELEFDRIAADRQTVHMKDKTMFRIIEISGIAYDTKMETEQENLLTIRSGLMKNIADQGVTMRLFAVKRKKNVSFSAEWPTEVLEHIGTREQELFSSTYALRWFMVLETKSLHALRKACGDVISTLRDYQARVLEGRAVFAVLNYLISGEMRDPESFPYSENVSKALPVTDLEFKDGTVHTATPEDHQSRVMSIRGWPEGVSGQILAELLALKGDVEFHQIIRPESVLATKSKASAEERAEVGLSALFLNPEKAQERETIIELLNADAIAMVMTQSGIVYRAKTAAELSRLEQQIVDILNRWRIVYAVDRNCVGLYWFNRLPGNNRLVRELKLMSSNIAGLWAFHNSPAGQYQSPWGDRPLRLFKTPVGQNYALNFFNDHQPESLGHFLIIAPAGGGKSTLMAHLLGGLAKFDVPSMTFDSHQGMRWMIECMGGNYANIGNLELNPFDFDHDPESNAGKLRKLHLVRLLRSMGTISDAEINLCLEQVFMIPREERSLNMIFGTGLDSHGEAVQSFAPFVTDAKGNAGMYSHFFNAQQDCLSSLFSGAFMTGIDLGDILSDEKIAAPIVLHIADSLKTMSQTKGGFCVFIDEAAALLKNAGFKDNVAQMYREYRKLGGAVGMAFQDPKALFDSGIADAVLDNTATIMLLPNSQGSPKSYERFGLNDEQINYILTGSALSSQRTAMIIKRDSKGFEESAIIDTDLSPFGADILKYYQSGTRALKNLDALQTQWGAEWRKYL